MDHGDQLKNTDINDNNYNNNSNSKVFSADPDFVIPVTVPSNVELFILQVHTFHKEPPSNFS